MPPAESIKAYDIPERVASYDADMELMKILKNAGLNTASALWIEYREAVTGGFLSD